METVPVSKFRTTCLALLQKVKKTRKPLLILYCIQGDINI
jgi:PHD/YefM family antitoxin component YafN of YafNO toxin-antitoxin module